MNNIKMPDGVKLVKSDTFWPEGRWYFIREDLAVPLVWGKTEGWKKYYESNNMDSHFHSEEDAMKAWESSNH